LLKKGFSRLYITLAGQTAKVGSLKKRFPKLMSSLLKKEYQHVENGSLG
jgi:hypothetical protein